ncbi:hypothetical protein RB608_16775 [Nocardioides sp. LHD-245]|uniref:hypothetical protein n=1 Tax=Nocardioides sp. LHD-245 TaxID=3051387 RepID=UPI0027E1FFFE|nr:hypothetical protein [Nocardioides sp. LHD-245]
MVDLSELDAAALLAAEESGVRQRRQGDVDELLRLLAWCDLHSTDPQSQPGAVPARLGGDRLCQLGGEGTPQVAELCFAEFAIAGQAGTIATTHRAAAALDLRHRLPLLWQRVQNLDIEVWVARKIADLSRPLTKDAVALVDTSLAAAHDLPTGKLIELAEARTIEADPETHHKRIAAEEARTGVFTCRRRPARRSPPSTDKPTSSRSHSASPPPAPSSSPPPSRRSPPRSPTSTFRSTTTTCPPWTSSAPAPPNSSPIPTPPSASSKASAAPARPRTTPQPQTRPQTHPRRPGSRPGRPRRPGSRPGRRAPSAKPSSTSISAPPSSPASPKASPASRTSARCSSTSSPPSYATAAST